MLHASWQTHKCCRELSDSCCHHFDGQQMTHARSEGSWHRRCTCEGRNLCGVATAPPEPALVVRQQRRCPYCAAPPGPRLQTPRRLIAAAQAVSLLRLVAPKQPRLPARVHYQNGACSSFPVTYWTAPLHGEGCFQRWDLLSVVAVLFGQYLEYLVFVLLE